MLRHLRVKKNVTFKCIYSLKYVKYTYVHTHMCARMNARIMKIITINFLSVVNS